jgi:immune inhibitor A
MSNKKSAILPVILIAVGCLCCAGIGGSALVGYWAMQPIPTSAARTITPSVAVDLTPEDTPLGGTEQTVLPGGAVLDVSAAFPPEALETLQSLINGDPPAGDMIDEAERLGGATGIPRVVSESAAPVAVGATQSFYVNNSDTDENASISAVMRYATPHVYFWVQQGLTPSDADIRSVVDTFENKIYPTDREFFGSEWTPGVDGDVHLYILWSGGLGSNVGGYYSSADEVSRKAHKFSNQHEMFYMNADVMELSDPYVLTVLAHEFQHMIHWYGDKNEESWVNEGFADLAASLNGYEIGGVDFLYADNTDIQLTFWPDINDNESGEHYGGAFMFMNYFLGRFGSDASKALVRNPLNGLTGIDDTLKQLNLADSVRNRQTVSEDVMADFAAAMLLRDTSIADGRYGFKEYPQAPELGDISTLSGCPTQKQTKKVSQFGFDYYAINCSGALKIYFAGQTSQKVLPVAAEKGKYYVWSNRGDESDMTLTRAFDIPSGSKATLQFDTWYDIEENWDYVYLLASDDNGQTWNIVKTKFGTDANPQGANYGWAWTGKSEDAASASDTGWVTESADLSAYAGKQVLVRFEYVTDAAVNGEGLIVDNIRVPELGYQTDFETGLDGWEGKGFVRLQNVLPQSYRVLVVRKGSQTTVQELALDDRESGNLEISAGNGEKVYVIVLGTARYTNQKAPYQLIVLT